LIDNEIIYFFTFLVLVLFMCAWRRIP